MIRLEPVSGKNVRQVLRLRVSDAQQSFVAPNDLSLAEAYLALSHHGQAFPFGIFDDETPVGFCMIGFGTDDEWTDAPAIAEGNYNLWRLMIDARYQGRGFGRAAMKLILDFIAGEPCGPADFCWLSYEPENPAAKSLYASFGFEETGDMDGDELIAALPLKRNMSAVRYAAEVDRAFWFSLDRHLPEGEFALKVRDRMGYVLTREGKPVAILRCSLFWDSIPFCNLLFVKDGERGRGFGRKLMEHWERDMKARGFDLVMTSTQSDEEAQHFYRRLGYRDCGGLALPFAGYEQPLEIILAKKV